MNRVLIEEHERIMYLASLTQVFTRELYFEPHNKGCGWREKICTPLHSIATQLLKVGVEKTPQLNIITFYVDISCLQLIEKCCCKTKQGNITREYEISIVYMLSIFVQCVMIENKYNDLGVNLNLLFLSNNGNDNQRL